MTNPHRWRRLKVAGAVALVMLLGFGGSRSSAQPPRTTRQVTVFGIVAVPGTTTIDPKLKLVAPQLRKLLPNHGFRLLDVKSKRLAAGETVSCELGAGTAASATLILPLDDNGKVQVRCALVQNGAPQSATVVATPPNQLFFCDKQRDDGTRLLIGIGAR